MASFFEYLNLFGPISNKTIELLEPYLNPGVLKKGEIYIQEGEVSKEIAFLEEGIVRAFYTTADGNEYNKTIFSSPAIIGSYVSLITNEPNRLPQQALTDCSIIRLDFRIVEKLSSNSIELERIRRKIAEDFFVGNEKKQLDFYLLDAKERYKIFRDEHPGLEEKIPQYHIASYLGITPTQLSRLRQKLT